MSITHTGATLARGLAIISTLTCATSGYAATVALGAAQSFAVLGGSSVTSTGLSVITGNLGTSPGTSITGFGPGVVVSGSTNSSNALADQAHDDAASAYTNLSLTATTSDLTGQNLGGLTLNPGVFNFTSSAAITGTLTLDGLNMTDPLFIFKIVSTLDAAAASAIVFVNGASAANVYFQVGTSTTIGAGATLAGTFISSDDTTLGAAASVNGRLITLTGGITMINNAITIPEPGTSALAFGAGILLLARRGRKS